MVDASQISAVMSFITKRRWARLTPAQRRDHAMMMVAARARNGTSRWRGTTAEQRREHAMMMIAARARKARARKRGKKAKGL